MSGHQLTRLTDADKAVDFTQAIQGHVSQHTKQVFNLERARDLVNHELAIQARENIVKDQFGNLYVVFVARLMDGDVWSVTNWVGADKWDGLSKRIVLVREWKKFKTFSDDLLTYLQQQAFVAFGKANVAYLKGQHAARLTSIQAVETEMSVHVTG
jgi:hypothetical protein